MNRIKALILFTVFIDLIGIGIVIPILPLYAESFGASPFVVTALLAVFAACSFLSGPVMGAVSDRIGRRPMLLLSIASTSVGWFVFAAAGNIFTLFVGRIIDGLAAGNLPIAQSYLVDIAKDDKERTANLGLIGAMFGIGFIVGPLLGGVLGSISHTLPFYFAGALGLINLVLGYFFLPETHHKENRNTAAISVNPFAPLLNAARHANLRPNYVAWFLFGCAFASMQSISTLYMKDQFQFGAASIGLVFAGIGIIIALNQTVGLRHFWLKYFKEPALELNMLLVGAAGFIFLAYPTLWAYAVGTIAVVFMQAVLRVVMTSQIVAEAGPARRGEVLGVTSSLTSLALTIAPLAAGTLYTVAIFLPFILSSLILLIAFGILYFVRKTLPRRLSDQPIISEL
jgi:DHA1 family tetracycline resistance protein-like MFS transporter